MLKKTADDKAEFLSDLKKHTQVTVDMDALYSNGIMFKKFGDFKGREKHIVELFVLISQIFAANSFINSRSKFYTTFWKVGTKNLITFSMPTETREKRDSFDAIFELLFHLQKIVYNIPLKKGIRTSEKYSATVLTYELECIKDADMLNTQFVDHAGPSTSTPVTGQIVTGAMDEDDEDGDDEDGDEAMTGDSPITARFKSLNKQPSSGARANQQNFYSLQSILSLENTVKLMRQLFEISIEDEPLTDALLDHSWDCTYSFPLKCVTQDSLFRYQIPRNDDCLFDIEVVRVLGEELPILNSLLLPINFIEHSTRHHNEFECVNLDNLVELVQNFGDGDKIVKSIVHRTLTNDFISASSERGVFFGNRSFVGYEYLNWDGVVSSEKQLCKSPVKLMNVIYKEIDNEITRLKNTIKLTKEEYNLSKASTSYIFLTETIDISISTLTHATAIIRMKPVTDITEKEIQMNEYTIQWLETGSDLLTKKVNRIKKKITRAIVSGDRFDFTSLTGYSAVVMENKEAGNYLRAYEQFHHLKHSNGDIFKKIEELKLKKKDIYDSFRANNPITTLFPRALIGIFKTFDSVFNVKIHTMKTADSCRSVSTSAIRWEIKKLKRELGIAPTVVNYLSFLTALFTIYDYSIENPLHLLLSGLPDTSKSHTIKVLMNMSIDGLIQENSKAPSAASKFTRINYSNLALMFFDEPIQGFFDSDSKRGDHSFLKILFSNTTLAYEVFGFETRETTGKLGKITHNDRKQMYKKMENRQLLLTAANHNLKYGSPLSSRVLELNNIKAKGLTNTVIANLIIKGVLSKTQKAFKEEYSTFQQAIIGGYLLYKSCGVTEGLGNGVVYTMAVLIFRILKQYEKKFVSRKTSPREVLKIISMLKAVMVQRVFKLLFVIPNARYKWSKTNEIMYDTLKYGEEKDSKVPNIHELAETFDDLMFPTYADITTTFSMAAKFLLDRVEKITVIRLFKMFQLIRTDGSCAFESIPPNKGDTMRDLQSFEGRVIRGRLMADISFKKIKSDSKECDLINPNIITLNYNNCKSLFFFAKKVAELEPSISVEQVYAVLTKLTKVMITSRAFPSVERTPTTNFGQGESNKVDWTGFVNSRFATTTDQFLSFTYDRGVGSIHLNIQGISQFSPYLHMNEATVTRDIVASVLGKVHNYDSDLLLFSDAKDSLLNVEEILTTPTGNLIISPDDSTTPTTPAECVTKIMTQTKLFKNNICISDPYHFENPLFDIGDTKRDKAESLEVAKGFTYNPFYNQMLTGKKKIIMDINIERFIKKTHLITLPLKRQKQIEEFLLAAEDNGSGGGDDDDDDDDSMGDDDMELDEDNQ